MPWKDPFAVFWALHSDETECQDGEHKQSKDICDGLPEDKEEDAGDDGYNNLGIARHFQQDSFRCSVGVLRLPVSAHGLRELESKVRSWPTVASRAANEKRPQVVLIISKCRVLRSDVLG